MFLDRKFGYTESLDYSTLPGFEKLSEEQQKYVHEEFERGYLGAVHMGMKIALGKGHETAKIAMTEAIKLKAVVKSDPAPCSIFYGLENCN